MFKARKQARKDEKWDIFRIIPKVEIAGLARDDGMPDRVRHDDVQDDEIAGQARNDVVWHDDSDIIKRFSIDLEERLKCNMRQSKDDACMLEKIINNKP